MYKKNIIILLVFIICIISVMAKSNKNYDKCDAKLLPKIKLCLNIPKNKLKETHSDWYGFPAHYYERSKCFFDLAIEERKTNLCSRVIQHKENSFYNPQNCNKYVTEKIEKDKKKAQRYLGKLYHIDEAYFSLNGNGKDFDFIIKTSGDVKAGYHLTLELYDGEENLGSLYEDGTYCNDKIEERNYYIKKEKLINLLKNKSINKIYRVKVLFSLNINDFEFITAHIHDKDKFIDTKIINVDFSKLNFKQGNHN